MRKRFRDVREFCQDYGIGLTKFYAEIRAGRLKARKVGRKTLVADEDAEAWAAALPVMGGADAVLT